MQEGHPQTTSKPPAYTILLLSLAPSERDSALSKHAVLCSGKRNSLIQKVQ